MERLTNKKEADAQRRAYEKRLEQGYPRNIPEERLLRLAAYEDTGLEPEDVTDLMAAHGTAIGALAKYRALGPVEELTALVKARDEGRVVVLPEKISKHAKQTSVELDCMTEILKPCGDFKVKPCPFCGSKNIVYWQYRHAAGLRWRIACLHCLAMIDPGWVQQYGYLADMWNASAEAERALSRIEV